MDQPQEVIRPHGWCRFSLWGWGTTAFLALYVLFMHSQFWTERQTLWVEWSQRAEQVIDTRLNDAEAAFQQVELKYVRLSESIQFLERDCEVLRRYQCL